MIEILRWSTLLVCALVAAARVPSALRGENRSLFGIFVFATLAMLLSIDTSYRIIDSMLGSRNYANLILRFVIYGVVLLAGYKIVRGFDAKRSVRLITGPVGLTVLALVAALTLGPFLLANTAGTSTGLATLADRTPHNLQLILVYTVVGRLYPSYVAACLLPATVGALRRPLPALVRSGAALLTVGAVAMVLLSLSDLLPPRLGFLQYVLSSSAVLGLILGLALIWFGRVRAVRLAGKSDAVAPFSPADR